MSLLYVQYWESLIEAVRQSRRVALLLLGLLVLLAVVIGLVLTPASSVPAVPFVIPIIIAAFRFARWIWYTAGAIIPLYALIALLQEVPASSVLINGFALILLAGVVVSIANERIPDEERARFLQEMERNLLVAMRQSGLRLFSHDRNLRYSWVPHLDPEFARNRMLGATDEELFPPDEARTLMAIKRQALETGIEVHKEVVLTVGGSPRIFDLRVVPVYSEKPGVGKPSGITCVSFDVTELKRLLAEREEFTAFQAEALADAARAQANLERFISMIAHDLVQPLTVIQGYVEVLRRRLSPDATPPQLQALDALNRSVGQMGRLISDLRDVAALEQARFSLNVQPVNLVSVIREVAADYQNMTDLHTIRVHAPEHLWGHVDPARVRQLIGNLLSNAVKYSPEGGEIDVSVRSGGNVCNIDVSDHGLGMSPDQLNSLFEMFSRLDNSRRIQGLGLGLYISRGIAEAHGGSIRVESDPGKGSKFFVTLPLAPRVVVDSPLPSSRSEGQQVGE